MSIEHTLLNVTRGHITQNTILPLPKMTSDNVSTHY